MEKVIDLIISLDKKSAEAEKLISEITVELYKRLLKYHSENLVVQLIELAGKAGISSEIIKDYIIESDCFICVYDITNINSVQELISLVKFYENIIPENNKEQFWYFVGNKNDDSRRECTNRQEKLFPDVPKKGRSVFNINGKVIVKENFGFTDLRVSVKLLFTFISITT